MAQSVKYEMMVALKPLLPDDVRKSVHKSIQELATELGGSVDDSDVWGKRYLAYKIQGHNEGYYIVYLLSLPTPGLKELKRQMELKQEILRYMIVRINRPEEIGSSLKKKNFKEDIDREQAAEALAALEAE